MFKNLNQLKKGIKVGQKVRVKNHLKGTSEERLVLQVKTNGLVTGKEISREEYEEKNNNWMTSSGVRKVDDKYFSNVVMDYQKAKNMSFEGNVVGFLAFVREDYQQVMVPSPDFNEGEAWLELEFIK